MESRFYDPEIEAASRDELRSLQERKLKAIVQHAWDHSPFYKKSFQEANITLDKIRSLDDIKKLPFPTKEDLRKDQETHPPSGGLQGSSIAYPSIDQLSSYNALFSGCIDANRFFASSGGTASREPSGFCTMTPLSINNLNLFLRTSLSGWQMSWQFPQVNCTLSPGIRALKSDSPGLGRFR